MEKQRYLLKIRKMPYAYFLCLKNARRLKAKQSRIPAAAGTASQNVLYPIHISRHTREEKDNDKKIIV